MVEILIGIGILGGLGLAFGEILSWTLMWSFFATFSNYFLGMFVAMMINKKGIKLKKLWRTVLVLTIAIPQFVSLLYVSKLFTSSGIVGELLGKNVVLAADVAGPDAQANAAALQPGDLVLFNDPSRNAGKACSHAGIYIGNGQHIHSSSAKNGVVISSLTSGYYNQYFIGGIHV